VTSLRVPESKLRGTRWNPLLKTPQGWPRETGGLVLLGNTYWEDFPGGEEVAIDIALLQLPPGTELPEHTHTHAVSPFYEACGINDMSIRSVLCLFATILGGVVFTATTSFVCAKTDDRPPWGNAVE
jgi:hypothetical protein